jgi:hypothetical protein
MIKISQKKEVLILFQINKCKCKVKQEKIHLSIKEIAQLMNNNKFKKLILATII